MTLRDRIASRVRSDGPMPFEDFMRMALYDSEGFFGGSKLRSESAGDFLTSPEVSPLFGRTLANHVRQEHERIADPFLLVEVAAGSGSLLRPLLEAYPVDALAVEVSPAARDALHRWVPTAKDLPERFRGVLIANELLDNLPMALAQRVDGIWRERWVGLDGESLVFVDTEAREPVLDWLARYAGDCVDGDWVEVQLEALDWLESALNAIEAGSIVLIDYGDTAENLLSRRRDGTLRTYRAHHLGPHPLDEPGETDITADVNFTALLGKVAAYEHRFLRQDDFLAELGLRERLTEIRHLELSAARAGDARERLRLKSLKTEAETLMHPRGLGDFRVLTVTV